MITLELTQEEAMTIRAILASVGGCPHDSARQYSDTMIDKLDDLGIEYWQNLSDKYKCNGSVQFCDYES